MKRIYIFLLLVFHLSTVCIAQIDSCENPTDPSSIISHLVMKRYSYELYQKCWVIKVPEGSYTRLQLVDLNFNGMSCSNSSVKISVAGTNEEYKFCSKDTDWFPIIALNDVTITYTHVSEHSKYFSLFKLKYSTEKILCAREDHFRCSNQSCVRQNQVCDGVMDCENGKDEDECGKDISNQKRKLKMSMHVPYSLYIGDEKNTIYSISVTVPENSSAYNIMMAAEKVHPKYRFLHHDMYGHPYVFEIAGVKSDPEAGKFWYLYTFDSAANGLVKHSDKNIDEFIVRDGEHLIMWYKTFQDGGKN